MDSEPSERRPDGYEPPPGEPGADSGGTGGPMPSGWLSRFLLSATLEQARRRMRWAWLAGLAWWVWNTGLLLLWLLAPGIDPDDPGIPDFPVRVVIYQGVEGFVVGMLALGVNFRWRLAAALLPVVFLLARVIALTRLEPLAFDARTAFWMAVYVLLLLLFVRGVQGAFSYHWHTHPAHPPSNV